MCFVQIPYLFLVAALCAVILDGQAHAQNILGEGIEGLTGTPENPLQVGIGIKIDQITSVDQKAENYGAVIVLRAEWIDPALAFDPEELGRDVQVFNPLQSWPSTRLKSERSCTCLCHPQSAIQQVGSRIRGLIAV